MNKKPKSQKIVISTKTPKEIKVSFEAKFISEGPSIVLVKQAISLPLQSRIKMLMRWSTERKDIVDKWSWGPRRWTHRTWKTEILPFLLNCEKKRWFEIEAEKADGDKRHKYYSVSQICYEARSRLAEIKLDDLEQVFRFRLGAKKRLYGFLIQHIFYVLWWDPEHNIFPTSIQNRGKIRLG